MNRIPHAPYMDAVFAAMRALHIEPTDYTVDDSEAGTDGSTMTLSAVFSWDGDVSADRYPDGLLLCWDLDREWQHAAMKADGSNEWPEDLYLPLWALPADVAASAWALLHGGELPTSTGEWSDPVVLANVREWVAS